MVTVSPHASSAPDHLTARSPDRTSIRVQVLTNPGWLHTCPEFCPRYQ